MVRPLLCRVYQRLHPEAPTRASHIFVMFGCATLMLALSTVPAEAQRRHRGGRVTVIRSLAAVLGRRVRAASTILTIWAFGQWYPYPYPVFGLSARHLYSRRWRCRAAAAGDAARRSVYVDGYAAGRVDDYDGVFQRLRLVPGPHEIVIYHPSHRTLRQNIYYNPGSTHTIRHTLEPCSAGDIARAAAGAARHACVSAECPGSRPSAGSDAARLKTSDPEGTRGHARAARAAGRCDGARRRRAMARAADAGSARHSARRRAASRTDRETRDFSRSPSTSTCAPAKRPASTSVCSRSNASRRTRHGEVKAAS